MDQPPTPATPFERNPAALAWFGLAVSALAVAGMFSLVLVVGRIPGLAAEIITSPRFAKRCLAVHVNLALVVWFYSFIASMFCLIPGRVRSRNYNLASAALAALGVAAFVLSLPFTDGEPVLANYIPAIDHPMFFAGLGAFALAVALNFVDGRLFSNNLGTQSDMPEPAIRGLRAAGAAFFIALTTFAATWWTLTEGSGVDLGLLFWGGGHVLQFVSVCGMLAAWSIMLHGLTGRSPVGKRASMVLFAVLIAPLPLAPVIPLAEWRQSAYTTLMQWGIFPAVSLFLILCFNQLYLARRDGRLPKPGSRDVRLIGFFTAATMTVFGFILGALITEETTLVPAHYHLSIGAVTATFMAMSYGMMERFGMAPRGRKITRLVPFQPLIFGIGQSIFAFGLAMAGTWGAAERKTYGKDQVLHTTGEVAGLWVMGIGGGIALVGGVIFLLAVINGWRSRKWD